MVKTGPVIKDQSSAGDTAVSGLFSGLQGGLAMAAVIGFYSLLAGQGLGYLGYLSSGAPVMPLVGLMMHLAVSCIYGMLFALVRHWTRLDHIAWLPGWLAGIIYAVGLWVIGVTVLLPTARSLILTLPWYIFFSGHVAYGLVLGLKQKP
jgi:hypothetical protein